HRRGARAREGGGAKGNERAPHPAYDGRARSVPRSRGCGRGRHRPPRGRAEEALTRRVPRAGADHHGAPFPSRPDARACAPDRTDAPRLDRTSEGDMTPDETGSHASSASGADGGTPPIHLRPAVVADIPALIPLLLRLKR